MNFYIIGIKGSGMSALACLLFDLGNKVIGYDDSEGYKFTMEGLEKRKIKIYHGKEVPKDLPSTTIITYTAAINENHHEIKRLKSLGYNVIPYKDIMGFITRIMRSICICGTHGKTTTTLMLSKIFNKTFGCSYFVGDGTGYGNLTNNYLIIESCEFNRHFLSYNPEDVIVTNIELDHTETYPNIESIIASFQEFIDKAKNKVVLCGDDQNILKLKTDKAIYYGFNETNDLVIKNKKVLNNKTCFDVYYQNKLYDHYEINMFGNHLVLDCGGAILMSILYKVDKMIIKEVLENFTSPKRRFNETIINDNVIIDDYAHHPTEIKVTYDSAHQKYADKRIIAIFLPNTYSRTEALFDDFVSALSIYDKAYIMDINSDREVQSDYPNINSNKLIAKVPNSEKISLETINKLKNVHNTVLCFMSCAYISPMVEKAKEILK